MIRGAAVTGIVNLASAAVVAVFLLRRYRSGDEDELVQRGILLTMSGLATALRNSG